MGWVILALNAAATSGVWLTVDAYKRSSMGVAMLFASVTTVLVLSSLVCAAIITDEANR